MDSLKKRTSRNSARRSSSQQAKQPSKTAITGKRPRKSAKSRMSARELRGLATLRRQMESARDRLGAHVLVLLDAVDVALKARRKGAEAIELAEQLEAAAVVSGVRP